MVDTAGFGDVLLDACDMGQRNGLTAGSFLRDGKRTFWDVHDPAESVIIRLRDEHYSRLVVGVEDPAATVAQVRAPLAGRPPA